MSVAVLCVHSDTRALMARSLLLSIAGYHVQTADSADIAIHKFADSKFDLVIADHCLPALNGAQLAGLMKESQPAVQVVLMTDNEPSSSRANIADLVLSKCQEPEQFLSAIGELVARRRPSLVTR